jgi:hypothetical protein
MPGETGTHKIPYALGADSPPSVPTITKSMAEKIEALLSKGGDVTIAADGTVTIAGVAVSEAKIADKAVTSRKLKPTAAGKTQNETKALEAAYIDVPGTTLEITPAVTSNLLVIANFKFKANNATDSLVGALNVDGEDKPNTADWFPGVANALGTATLLYPIELTAAAHTIKMRAKRAAGTGGEVLATGTKMLYVLFGS